MTKIGPAKCDVTLAKQESSSKCTLGKSFGCYDGPRRARQRQPLSEVPTVEL
jgi:hypothetical protein